MQHDDLDAGQCHDLVMLALSLVMLMSMSMLMSDCLRGDDRDEDEDVGWLQGLKMKKRWATETACRPYF